MGAAKATPSHDESREALTWDEWFDRFDDENLAALHQPTEPASPETSQVIKRVDRETLKDSSTPPRKR